MKKQLLTLLLSGIALSSMSQTQSQIPFEGMDQTWANGSDRRDSAVLTSKYFTGSVMIDANANYSFANPIDHTVVGSTALARTNEMQISAASFGGDFVVKGKLVCKLFVICNNLLNTGYIDYMSRFKYLPVNYTSNRVGVFNMGRNVSLKLLIPINF